MNKIISNKRITFRDSLNIIGQITIKNKGIYEEKIHIINMTYEGIQIVFANNNFLYEYLKYINNTDVNIIIKFEFLNKNFEFSCLVKWLNLYNIGERNYYILSGLNFINKEKVKHDILDIIFIAQMQTVYFG